MKVYKFLPPYDEKGKCTFRAAKERPGVYIIKEDSKIVYVGKSGYNLYKTMYRHFQSWHHSQQDVVSYKNRLSRHRYTVRVVYTTANQANALEEALILKYKPRDNDQKLELYTTPKQKSYKNETAKTYFDTDVETDLPF